MKFKLFLIFILLLITFIFLVIQYDKYSNFNEYDPPDSLVFSNLLFYTYYSGDYSKASPGGYSYFNDHSGFIGILLAPILIIIHSPFAIVFLNVFLNIFSAFFLYLLSEKYLKRNIAFFFFFYFFYFFFFF